MTNKVKWTISEIHFSHNALILILFLSFTCFTSSGFLVGFMSYIFALPRYSATSISIRISTCIFWSVLLGPLYVFRKPDTRPPHDSTCSLSLFRPGWLTENASDKAFPLPSALSHLRKRLRVFHRWFELIVCFSHLNFIWRNCFERKEFKAARRISDADWLVLMISRASSLSTVSS